MNIIFSNHALLKINHRNISKEYVLKAVNNPDFSQPSRNFREELYKKFGNRYLKVVVKRTRKNMIIVTAHWIAKFRSS